MILGVTGHRPDKLGGYNKKTDTAIFEMARHFLGVLEPDEVISGMALGWDQAIVKACIDLEIPFTAAIPFKGQEGKWPDFQKEFYYKMLEKARQVINTTAQVYYNPVFMFERNEWIVDHSDTILALWNGSDGGTSHCVKYALLENKPVINVWEYYGEFKK